MGFVTDMWQMMPHIVSFLWYSPSKCQSSGPGRQIWHSFKYKLHKLNVDSNLYRALNTFQTPHHYSPTPVNFQRNAVAQLLTVSICRKDWKGFFTITRTHRFEKDVTVDYTYRSSVSSGTDHCWSSRFLNNHLFHLLLVCKHRTQHGEKRLNML